MALLSINHTSFTVADAGALAEWYCDRLGFEVAVDARRPQDYTEKVTGIPGAELRNIYIKGGGYHIELVEYTKAKGVRIDTATNNPGSAHIAYNVDDMQGMYERLSARGVKFISPPIEIPDGPNAGGRVVYLEDPEGNTLEFIERPAG
ncbi:MAG: VOC family protein [bacterium]|nr:VOC family protein [bacterium]